MVRGGRGEVRGVSAQAGKSPADRRGAGQPVPGSCSASSALRAAAPARSRRAAQRLPRPSRGAGEPGSPAAERGGPAGPVCACVLAAQPAAGQGPGASGPGGHWLLDGDVLEQDRSRGVASHYWSRSERTAGWNKGHHYMLGAAGCAQTVTRSRDERGTCKAALPHTGLPRGAQYVPSGATGTRKESARQLFPSRLCRGPG
ncbi:uncharacterized protein LOC122697029 isoform X2 [Cervus elaphus]|nr:uncharacterized protein LOC122697029 isoform X2 [Cervus elaphus]